MNLYDYLLHDVPADKLALVSQRERVTYADLIGYAESVAAALAQHGIGKGDRVALLADNSAFWAASYLSCLKLGAVAVPLPARLSVDAFTATLAALPCAAFCADEGRFSRYRDAFPPYSRILLPADAVPQDAPHTFMQPISGATSPTADIDDRQDLAALMFTSGSTGQPNAVKITHRNIIANSDAIIEAVGITPDDVMLVVLPFDYCFGTSLLHTHLRVGATLVLSNFTFPERALDDMERFGCTSIAGVPGVYQHLLRRSTVKERALPHFRSAQQAGGRLSDALIDEFTAALPDVRFHVMYGQTEATARLTVLPSDRLRNKRGSVGRAVPGVTLRIMTDASAPVDRGETAAIVANGESQLIVGEIVAEGDSIAMGYALPNEVQRFRDGRLHTGDLGYLDDEGFLFITGRASDFLKLSGHRVSSREIEDVLYALPDVLEAAVIGAQGDDGSEIARAYVVIQPGAALDAKQVIDHCKRRLPAYAVPREVVFLPELPKNAAGKILKSAL